MELIEILFPIVAITTAGYFIRLKSYLSDTDGLSLEKVSFNILIPCLLFFGTATADFPETIDWTLLGGFYISVLIVYLFGMLIARLLYTYSLTELSVIGMGSSYSNVTIIGIPLCLQVFGNAAFLPIFIIISIHNILLFGFGVLVAGARKDSSSTVLQHLTLLLKDILRNPIIVSLLSGMLVNLSNIRLYVPLASALSLISQAAVPMALFTLGGALTRYKIAGNVNSALIMVLLKLLLLPFLVWLFVFHVFDVDPLWAGTAVLLSATPVGISPYIFSIKYRACESQIASAIVSSSSFSIITISGFILLING